MIVLKLALIFLFERSITCQQFVDRSLKHGGSVRGIRETVVINTKSTDVEKYYGIPFALPPIGKRRFAQPVPHPGWKGIQNATTLPPTCWQYIIGGFDLNNPGARMWLNNTEMSEDCLYLNVWVPVTSQNQQSVSLPVMIWVYGGGFVTGSSTLTIYDGSYIAATQNVIVLSMQYRLGAFGLIRIDPESGTDGNDREDPVALGNQGLLDQALAIQWAYDNIASFGGDPTAITVFGESAGAVSVSMLRLSPVSRGLIKRVILQSGSVYARWGFQDLEEAHKRATEFTLACGCPAPSIDRAAAIRCLQEVDPLTLITKLDKVTTAVCQRRNMLQKRLAQHANFSYKFDLFNWAASGCLYFDVPFKPVVDGYFFPKQPDEIFQDLYATSGEQTTEMLIGVNRNEAMYFLLYGLSLHDATFLHENGSVELPKTVKLAASGEPLIPGGPAADFHLISVAQFLSDSMLVNGISSLPTWLYGLPTQSDTKTVYANPSQIKRSGEQLMQDLDAFTGDLDFKCPTLNYAQMFARISKSKVYFYHFLKRTQALTFPQWAGVMHGYELEYVFGMPHSSQFQKESYTFTEEERKFADRIMQFWGDFAKYGNPNGIENNADRLNWPEFKPSDGLGDMPYKYMALDDPLSVSSELRLNQCRFWLNQIPTMLNDVSNVTVVICGNAAPNKFPVLLPYIILFLLLTYLPE